MSTVKQQTAARRGEQIAGQTVNMKNLQNHITQICAHSIDAFNAKYLRDVNV